MKTENVYLNHANRLDYLLKFQSGGSTLSSVMDLSGVGMMSITLGSLRLDSTNSTAHVINWVGCSSGTYNTGEIHISLGTVTAISTGTYDAVLVVYTSDATADGYVWGDPIPINVKADPEGTT
jgi:hypothetical protein